MKKICQWLFLAFVNIAWLIYRIEGVNACLLLAPAKVIPVILRRYGARVGDKTEIHSPLLIHNAAKDYSNLVIGEQCYLGRAVFLDLKDSVVIEDRATVSMRATILTHFDAGRSRTSEFLPRLQAPVKIAKDAFVGASSTVLAGVSIGECAVIGAGSVVSKSVADYEIHAGVPAKKLRRLKG